MNEVKNSVLVVTYNRLEWLKKNIDSIMNQTKPFHKIYIVNNNSTDETLDYLSEIKKEISNVITINLEKNLGGAGGFHMGLKKFIESSLENEWISIMDDDCIIDKFYNERIISNLNNKKNSYTPFRYDFETKELNKSFCKDLKKINENIYFKKVVPFNGFTINRERILEIGLPNKEYFIYQDDYEYCYRIIKAGGENLCIKDAIIYHPNKIEKIEKIRGIKIGKNQLNKLIVYYGTRNEIFNKIKYKEECIVTKKDIIKKNIKKIIKYILINRFDLAILTLEAIKDGILKKKISKGIIK